MANFELALAKTRIAFYMHHEAAGYPNLAKGRLECYRSDGSGLIIPATSGLAGCQAESFLWYPGKGPIPPFDGYSVCTTPEPRPEKGIEGDFFRIMPNEVKSENVTRNGFGIHRDANVPGSAGCIVIADRLHFARFTMFMLERLAQGEKEVKLHVNYE
jgi:hypothetical protein